MTILERLEDRTYELMDDFEWKFGFPLAVAISALGIVISIAAILIAVLA